MNGLLPYPAFFFNLECFLPCLLFEIDIKECARVRGLAFFGRINLPLPHAAFASFPAVINHRTRKIAASPVSHPIAPSFFLEHSLENADNY
jgi:hypothetical protein